MRFTTLMLKKQIQLSQPLKFQTIIFFCCDRMIGVSLRNEENYRNISGYKIQEEKKISLSDVGNQYLRNYGLHSCDKNTGDDDGGGGGY